MVVGGSVSLTLGLPCFLLLAFTVLLLQQSLNLGLQPVELLLILANSADLMLLVSRVQSVEQRRDLGQVRMRLLEGVRGGGLQLPAFIRGDAAVGCRLVGVFDL